MATVNAYAATGATDPLVPTTIERRAVGPRDVLIEIKYSGICHTDIHTARNEWGTTSYPIVVGHEITGVVADAGAEVTRHAAGDRVGVGYIVDSCRACDVCHQGLEQHCLKGAITTYGAIGRDGLPTAGGYSTHIVVDEDFVLRIPDALPLDRTAPLLCAGITMYSPLRRFDAGPGSRVAIVGLGGLGHMGVKLANAMGAEVSVLSRSEKKREDALRLGADRFVQTSDPDSLAALAGSFDLVINTVSAPIDVNAHLGLLAVNGTMVEIGAPPEPLPFSAYLLLGWRRTLAGSMVGGIAETQEMLDFCAAHDLAADIELVSADQIDAAWRRVVASDVRYRFVIDAATFD
jgi:alcohol dehydrogenase (NADP+)